jgi:hypothetical protein
MIFRNVCSDSWELVEEDRRTNLAPRQRTGRKVPPSAMGQRLAAPIFFLDTLGPHCYK